MPHAGSGLVMLAVQHFVLIAEVCTMSCITCPRQQCRIYTIQEGSSYTQHELHCRAEMRCDKSS